MTAPATVEETTVDNVPVRNDGQQYAWNADRLNVTDDFGWYQETYESGPDLTPPIRHGDVVDMTRRSADEQLSWQPDDYEPGEAIFVGPVHGASYVSPWANSGIAPRNMTPQHNNEADAPGPVHGASNGVTTWRQWLAATEVPDSTVASETFASVFDFPYAFRD